jgi:hypothetical protein
VGERARLHGLQDVGEGGERSALAGLRAQGRDKRSYFPKTVTYFYPPPQSRTRKTLPLQQKTMRQRPFFCVLGILLLSLPGWAQKKNEQFQYLIQRASSSIEVDGRAADAAWQAAAVASDFFMVLPMDTSRAQVRTEVRMLYDDHHIYLLAVCYEGTEGPYMVESLRRDFSFGRNDNFIVFLDPFDDQTNGFAFGSNAEGAQWDGLIFEGGSVNLSWDNKWVSKVKNYADRWVFEAAIPFKSIRYKKGITEWGINFSRLDLKTTEKSGWAPVPRQFPSSTLAYTGTLVWDQPPPDPGANISLIPYTLGGFSKNGQSGEKATYKREIGLDAKVSLTSSLNLDLTINPDFSNVEVDRQVANLSRFEIFFPEQRQFFTENSNRTNRALKPSIQALACSMTERSAYNSSSKTCVLLS